MDNNSPVGLEATSGMAGVMQRNIRAVLERRRTEDKEKPLQQRIADAVTRFTGSLKFVYIHLALFGVWIIANLPGVPFPKFDPTYVVLAMFASVEAIFLSTFVLISQNRMAEQADNARISTCRSAFSRNEVTRLITLVKEIAEKLDVDGSRHPELPELQKDVAPERVLDALEENQRRISNGG